MSDELNEPWVEVHNEPEQITHRFRYKTEERRGGYIKGVHPGSPAIKVHNKGSSGAIIKVSCVSAHEPYVAHPHAIVGKSCDNGICVIQSSGSDDDIIRLDKVAIECCKKKDFQEALCLREQTFTDPFGTGFQYDFSRISLNCIRLCYEVFLVDNNQQLTKVLKPVVTQMVFNKKSYLSLEIRRLSKSSARARGEDELFILCDKVDKNDISVRFFATLNNGTEWEGYGNFTPLDVHNGCAVVCKTPTFPSKNLLHPNDLTYPVLASIQLVQPSTGMAGPSKSFQFVPNPEDCMELVAAKRRKISNDINCGRLISASSSIPRMAFAGGNNTNLSNIVGIPSSTVTSAESRPPTHHGGPHIRTNNPVDCVSNVQHGVDSSANLAQSTGQLNETFLDHLLSDLYDSLEEGFVHGTHVQ